MEPECFHDETKKAIEQLMVQALDRIENAMAAANCTCLEKRRVALGHELWGLQVQSWYFMILLDFYILFLSISSQFLYWGFRLCKQ